jgi:hypothetical protein
MRSPRSRKDNLKVALALHFAHYNFSRVRGSLRLTPAMAAGITKSHVDGWGIDWSAKCITTDMSTEQRSRASTGSLSTAIGSILKQRYAIPCVG